MVYLQYSSIGEMTTYKPVHGGFIRQCAEYVDPAFRLRHWNQLLVCGENGILGLTLILIPFHSRGRLTELSFCAISVGHDYASRNHPRSVCVAILARDRGSSSGSVYHHLPGRHCVAQCLPRPNLRPHRILHVLCEMSGRGRDDLLHVRHDVEDFRCQFKLTCGIMG